VAIVIVGGDMRIRRITPMAERVLNLIPTDVGRPITHIQPNINCPDLEKLIREAVAEATPIEREVQDRQGNWYALRIRPYQDAGNRIDGAVLALIDINLPRRHRAEIREVLDYVQTVFESTGDALVAVDGALRIKAASPAFGRACGTEPGKLLGQGLLEAKSGQWDVPGVRALLTETLSAAQREGKAEVEVAGKRWRVTGRRVALQAGQAALTVLALQEAGGGTAGPVTVYRPSELGAALVPRLFAPWTAANSRPTRASRPKPSACGGRITICAWSCRSAGRRCTARSGGSPSSKPALPN
jgi:PAS domain-containing protein